MPYLGKQADESGAVINSYEFLQGTDTSSGTTAFSVSSNEGDHVEVYLNGILVVEGGSNDYTRTTTAITFATAPSDGDSIIINIIGSITIFDTVPSSGGTFTGDVSIDKNSKLKQKGAFMQSSIHQAWVLGG
tara:strand:+ start:3756 stop:4151 length:396 start_codon:yes stop_codon:yes gene_type:complete